jgi:predicted cobalt transporter CbtA
MGVSRLVKRAAPQAVLYLALLVAVVVGVDLAFFRQHLWARLLANVGIVLLFVAFYLRFLRRP